MTTHTAQLRRATAAAVLAAAAVASVVTGGAASADVQPYSQGEDYVRTLVYWHHNPDWGFGS